MCLFVTIGNSRRGATEKYADQVYGNDKYVIKPEYAPDKGLGSVMSATLRAAAS